MTTVGIFRVANAVVRCRMLKADPNVPGTRTMVIEIAESAFPVVIPVNTARDSDGVTEIRRRAGTDTTSPCVAGANSDSPIVAGISHFRIPHIR